MTTLEERIAEAILNASDNTATTSDEHWMICARAVVAVLPPMLVPVDESADGDIGPDEPALPAEDETGWRA